MENLRFHGVRSAGSRRSRPGKATRDPPAPRGRTRFRERRPCPPGAAEILSRSTAPRQALTTSSIPRPWDRDPAAADAADEGPGGCRFQVKIVYRGSVSRGPTSPSFSTPGRENFGRCRPAPALRENNCSVWQERRDSLLRPFDLFDRPPGRRTSEGSMHLALPRVVLGKRLS